MATTIEQVFEDIKALPPVKMQKVFEFVASIKEAENQAQITKPKVRTESSLKSKVSIADDFNAPLNSSKPSKAQLLSVLDDMAGCIILPDDFDMKAERHKHLEEKYLNA